MCEVWGPLVEPARSEENAPSASERTDALCWNARAKTAAAHTHSFFHHGHTRANSTLASTKR